MCMCAANSPDMDYASDTFETLQATLHSMPCLQAAATAP